MTKKLAYPLPNIEDCIETLAGKKFFTLLDFSSGFLQLPLETNSKEFTTFKTEDGLFQYKRMPFGLANAPSSFQRMVNVMFSGLRGVNLQVFIDDICFASDTFEEHMKMLDEVLNVVIESNMTLKSSKCVFGAAKILFLGHELSELGVRQDPNKPKPTRNKFEIQSPHQQIKKTRSEYQPHIRHNKHEYGKENNQRVDYNYHICSRSGSMCVRDDFTKWKFRLMEKNSGQRLE